MKSRNQNYSRIRAVFIRLNQSLLILSLLMVSGFCCLDLSAELIYVVNSESRTISRIDTATQQVNNAFASLGFIPNRLVLDDAHIYVVNSGDNAIQMINRLTGATIRYIGLGVSVNPWEAVLHNGYLYVTGLFTNRVYKISLQSYTVVADCIVGEAPQGLAVWGDKLYVSNTGGFQTGYANSSVSIIDLNTFSVVQTIPVWYNPQYLIARDGYIHVSCTGNWTNAFGKVYIIDTLTDTVIHTLEIGGSPGGLWADTSGKVWIGDLMNTAVYRYDTTDWSILNDSSNPLVPGGGTVDGTDAFIAILDSNWGQSGRVYLRYPDFSAWQQYTVGLAPTDLKVYRPTVANENLTQVPSAIMVSPNPAPRGSFVRFAKLDNYPKRISIYNLRGQLIKQWYFTGTETLWDGRDTQDRMSGTGVYLYRIEGRSTLVTGKILIH